MRILLATLLGLVAFGPAYAQFDGAKANPLIAPAQNGDQEAIQKLRGLAEEGDAVAQNGMGLVTGQARWHLLSARQGFRIAQFNIGSCYVRGCEGRGPDIERGLRWLTTAAYQGEWLAQATLGDLYRGRPGVARNDVESYKWYAVAASTVTKMGHPEIRETLLKRMATLAPRMTPEQIAEAQQLAQNWRQKPWSELRSNLPESTEP